MIGPLLSTEGIIVSTSQVIANLLADIFTVAFIPPRPISSNAHPCRVDEVHISKDGVKDVLFKLDVDVAMRHDEVQPYVLRDCAVEFAHPFTMIFEKSRQIGVLPGW